MSCSITARHQGKWDLWDRYFQKLRLAMKIDFSALIRALSQAVETSLEMHSFSRAIPFCSIVYGMIVKSGLIIVLAGVIFPVTLLITYIIAVCNKHVIPFWPYISHTGDDPIESCFFSLGLNIVSGLYALIVYLRYVQIRYLLARNTSKMRKNLNKSSLVWGLLAAFTLSVTSSFQQRNVSTVHLVAAVICSYTALGYFWHQTYFSFVLWQWMTKRVKIFRMVLSTASTFVHAVAPLLFLHTLLVHPMPGHKITEWDPDPETMFIYLTGALMEWLVFILNQMYIVSFYWEFQNIMLKPRQILIIK